MTIVFPSSRDNSIVTGGSGHIHLNSVALISNRPDSTPLISGNRHIQVGDSGSIVRLVIVIYLVHGNNMGALGLQGVVVLVKDHPHGHILTRHGVGILGGHAGQGHIPHCGHSARTDLRHHAHSVPTVGGNDGVDLHHLSTVGAGKHTAVLGRVLAPGLHLSTAAVGHIHQSGLILVSAGDDDLGFLTLYVGRCTGGIGPSGGDIKAAAVLQVLA